MAGSGAEKSGFWSHVLELRRMLLRVALILGVTFVGMFVAMPWIFDNIIMAPLQGDFPTYALFQRLAGGVALFQNDGDLTLININLGTQLLTQMSASMWVGLTVMFPVVLYQVWLFVRPGLYEHERRGATRAFLMGNAMFYLGLAVAYFLVFPLTLRFLAGYQLSGAIENTITLDSYMDTFYLLCIAFGLVFEMPLLAWLLGRVGVLSRKFFSRYRRHAVLGLLILAALITPTGDPITLFIVFVPLYALWEFSAWLVPQPEDDDDPDDDDPDDAPENGAPENSAPDNGHSPESAAQPTSQTSVTN